MKNILAGICAACLVATGPAAAADDPPLIFAASSDWALDYGEDYCRLMRSFSNGEDELTLALDRIQPGPMVRMMVSGQGLDTERRARTMTFRLGTDDGRESMILRAQGAGGASVYNLGEVYLAPSAAARTRDDQRALRGRYSRQQQREFAGSVQQIAFDGGVSQAIVLQTGSLAAPIEALQACADELVTYWGLDLSAQRSSRRGPAPANDMSTWLPAGTIDRQQVALLMGAQNQARLMINAEGVPTDCAIHLASLPAETNQAVCEALKTNARFTPAQDGNGQPMDGYWITQLSFLAQPRR